MSEGPPHANVDASAVRSLIARPWTWVVGGLVIALFGAEILSIARHKLFWVDEANEVLESCTRPYSDIVVNGPSGQCSRAPLYYLLQKTVVAHAGMSSRMLTTYRLISISAALLTLLIVFLGFTRHLGPSWALFAVAVLTIRPEFFQFAAESRPYMLWIFLFTASLMLVSALAYRPWVTLTLVPKAVLGSLLLGLTLVSAAGMFQAVAFLLLLSLWNQHSMSWRAWLRQPAFRFQLRAVLVCVGIGGYYAFRGCVSNYDAEKWDLLNTGDLSLVKSVLALIYPLSRGYVTWGLNLLVAVAVLTLLLWWRKRATLTAPKTFALSVILVSVGQLLCALFLAILVARSHYYFVPRVFLYLISLRAFLAASGAYVLLSMLLDLSGERFRFLQARAVQWLIFLGALSFVFLSHARIVARRPAEKITDRVKFDEATCPPSRSRIAIMDTGAGNFVASGVTYEFEHYKLNFVLGLDEQMKACGWTPAAEPVVYVVPNYARADRGIYGYEIRIANKASLPILGFLHQPVLPRAR